MKPSMAHPGHSSLMQQVLTLPLNKYVSSTSVNPEVPFDHPTGAPAPVANVNPATNATTTTSDSRGRGRGRGRGGRNQKDNPHRDSTCAYCSRKGHIEDIYYTKRNYEKIAKICDDMMAKIKKDLTSKVFSQVDKRLNSKVLSSKGEGKT
jgi:hypothetical protein